MVVDELALMTFLASRFKSSSLRKPGVEIFYARVLLARSHLLIHFYCRGVRVELVRSGWAYCRVSYFYSSFLLGYCYFYFFLPPCFLFSVSSFLTFRDGIPGAVV